MYLLASLIFKMLILWSSDVRVVSEFIINHSQERPIITRVCLSQVIEFCRFEISGFHSNGLLGCDAMQFCQVPAFQRNRYWGQGLKVLEILVAKQTYFCTLCTSLLLGMQHWFSRVAKYTHARHEVMEKIIFKEEQRQRLNFVTYQVVTLLDVVHCFLSGTNDSRTARSNSKTLNRMLVTVKIFLSPLETR